MVLYCKYCDQGLDSVKRSFNSYPAESKSLKASFKTLSSLWDEMSNLGTNKMRKHFRWVLRPQTSSQLFETPALTELMTNVLHFFLSFVYRLVRASLSECYYVWSKALS